MTSVGRIHPHVEAKVVDADGRIVPVGVDGELLIRGYCVMLGYWEDRERTAEAIDEAGWMHTGDLATIDEEGHCKIVGRCKDMVICAGENIYPREIEEVLISHPAIADVAVVGVPDPVWGESVKAYVAVREGQTIDEEEVVEFCKRYLAGYKKPKAVAFIPSIPRNPSGKALKRLLREKDELNPVDSRSL